MKKEYVRPTVEIIDFQAKDVIMVEIGGPGMGGGAGSGLWDEEEE